MRKGWYLENSRDERVSTSIKREKDISVTRLGWDKEKFRGFKQIIYMKLEQEEGRKNDPDVIAETLC